MARQKLLNPIALLSGEAKRLPVRQLDKLEGKRVGIIHGIVPYRGFEVLAEKLTAILPKKYGAKEVVNIPPAGAVVGGPQDVADHCEVYDKMAHSIDCAIVGAAFCGSCGFAATEAAVAMAERGIPAILLTKADFESLVKATSKAKGVEVNLLVLPAEINSLSDEEYDKLIEETWEEIEAGLLGRLK